MKIDRSIYRDVLRLPLIPLYSDFNCQRPLTMSLA